eukprot:11425656-Heterocapsa_arctica.AAC.1
MLANILTPPWTEDQPFMDQLLAWEKLIGDYEMITGAAVPDMIKVCCCSTMGDEGGQGSAPRDAYRHRPRLRAAE